MKIRKIQKDQKKPKKRKFRKIPKKIKVSDGLTPEARKIRNKKRTKRVLFLLKLFIIISVLVGTGVWMTSSPVFNIKWIEVYGNSHYTQQEIIDVTNIMQGINGFKTVGGSVSKILTFRNGSAEASIVKGRTYVKSAKVRYLIPSKVKIDIIERTPAAVIPYMSAYVLVDGEAYVLDTLNNIEGLSLPIIKGLDLEGYKPGQKLQDKNERAYYNAFKILNEFSEADKISEIKLYDTIKSVETYDPRNIKVLIDYRILVNFGEYKDMGYKIEYLKQVMKSLKKEDQGILDFSSGENPVFKLEQNIL